MCRIDCGGFITPLCGWRTAGPWERIQQAKQGSPYLLYLLWPSFVHRDQHLAWGGLLLPKGINPGFDYNPGQYRNLEVRVAFSDYIQWVVDAASAVLAERAVRVRVAEHVGGDLFRWFVEQAAQGGEDMEKIEDTQLAVVPKSVREFTKTSEVVLPLPALLARHTWLGHGPDSDRAEWEILEMEDWLEVQRILDTAPLYPQDDGRWILFVPPFKKSVTGKMVGFKLVLARDRANPKRLVPVTFFRIDAAGYRSARRKIEAKK